MRSVARNITSGAGSRSKRPKISCHRDSRSSLIGHAKFSKTRTDRRQCAVAEARWRASADQRAQLVAFRDDLLFRIAREIACIVIVSAHFVLGVAKHLIAVGAAFDMTDDVA